MPTTTLLPFEIRTDDILRRLHEGGQYKHLQTLEGPMDATVRMRQTDGSVRVCLCFCSNNYLGLANHPEVVEAGIQGLRRFGAGTASARFICGTFSPHETLEATIAEYLGVESAYTFVSCWNANEAVFPTLCEPGDIVISDELNHASLIDAIRLMSTIKKGTLKTIFKHNDHAALREKLEAARANPDLTGQIWVVTDGVFSMEGDIADLPGLRKLCDEFNALLVVDDSHGNGVMGETGRGVHEYYGMYEPWTGDVGSENRRTSEVSSESRPTSDVSSENRPTNGRVDVFTGTLGKALGGGAGGFVAGDRRVTELLVQRGRPTLFSNALPVTVACSANAAIRILMREPQRVKRLRDNVAYARAKIKDAGFDVLESPTAICPIIVHDTAKAIAMSRRLLELGVFVIGFGYPVVPEGEARLRVQISAAHETEHIDGLVAALRRL